jgi:hypothetical protein
VMRWRVQTTTGNQEGTCILVSASTVQGALETVQAEFPEQVVVAIYPAEDVEKLKGVQA